MPETPPRLGYPHDASFARLVCSSSLQTDPAGRSLCLDLRPGTVEELAVPPPLLRHEFRRRTIGILDRFSLKGRTALVTGGAGPLVGSSEPTAIPQAFLH